MVTFVLGANFVIEKCHLYIRVMIIYFSGIFMFKYLLNFFIRCLVIFKYFFSLSITNNSKGLFLLNNLTFLKIYLLIL